MKFEKRTLVVNGGKVEIHTADVAVTEIDDAMRRTPAIMAFWSSVYASAQRELQEAEAYYRNWRAKAKKALLAAAGGKPPAEWKLTMEVEAHDDFAKLKNAIAKAEENVLLARGMFDSFSKRANVLQSLGAMFRSELGATGMTTPEVEPSIGRSIEKTDPGDDAKEEALKQMALGMENRSKL